MFGIFALAAPDRLAIDLPALEFRISGEPLGPGGVGAIARVRHGRFDRETSRVVLDLAGPVALKRVFRLFPDEAGGPTRLVVDVAESHRAAFAAFARESQRRPVRTARTAPVENARGRPVVVIDPGHGGIDPGAPGREGPDEKTVALTAARHLRERLEETGRYRVVMTRDRDVFIGLRDRVAIAQDACADLFLSIHADSIGDPRIGGSHVYSLSREASDEEAEALAAKENESDLIGGVDVAVYPDEHVAAIVLRMSQTTTNRLSERLAALLVEAFARYRVKSIGRPHRRAGFAVLKAPDIPSLLIELGFLSNRQDERRLLTRAGREPAIRAIVDAVERHFAGPGGSPPPPQTGRNCPSS